MSFKFNIGCSVTAAIFAASFMSDSVFAQCDTTPPPGSFVSPDGCEHLGGAVDSNGGCNQTPAAFTNLGTMTSGQVLNVAGQMGLYIPTGSTTFSTRDLDWYLVTCPAGTLQVSLTTLNSLATGQLPSSVIFIKKNVGVDPCLGAFDVGIQSSACPHNQSVVAGAGTHMVVVTVPFDTTAGTTTLQACGQYLMKLTHTPLANPACGTSTDSCAQVHASGGCNLPACCEVVCNFNPLCCDTAWDQTCVDQAVASCGLFVYICNPPVGAPANDCATASQLITVGQSSVIVNNTNAGTDGPGDVASPCADAMGKDLWYTIKAPANGALTMTMCASGDATTDSVIEVYGLGTDPVMTTTRAESLPSMYIGCNDDGCGIVGGASAATLIDAVANNYYLIRIGGWYNPAAGNETTADTFSLTLVTTFEYVMYTTGSQHNVVTVATGGLVNLGLSSGCVSATLQQRWLAQAFTVPGSAATWNVSRMTVKGFVPAGNTNTTLNYVVWNRLAGNPAPTPADQLFAGSVPFPAAYDSVADDYPNAAHDIVASFALPSGNYYLTAYASHAGCGGSTFSNFAWFVSAYDGINLIDSAGLPFAWRSLTFPTPGFVKNQGLGTWTVVAGADPKDLYNTAFDIYGTPSVPACIGDYNNDGVVNGGDLALLLGSWGTPGGDLDGDGTTNGGDLAFLFANWGNCPG